MFNIELFWNLTECKQNLYLYLTELTELELLDETELFEIDLIIHIKMDLALNNLQRLICHKTQPNQPATFNILIRIIDYMFKLG